MPLIGGLPRALLSFAIGAPHFNPYDTSRGRRRRMKRARFSIGIAISLVCLALALRGIDLEGFVQALRSIRWTYLLLAFGLLVFSSERALERLDCGQVSVHHAA